MLGSDTGTLSVQADGGEEFQVSGQNEDVWVNVNMDIQIVPELLFNRVSH